MHCEKYSWFPTRSDEVMGLESTCTVTVGEAEIM